MILCKYNCTPCCDYCIYSIHETWYEKNKNNEWVSIIGGPIKCIKGYNVEKDDGNCNDFHCKNVKD